MDWFTLYLLTRLPGLQTFSIIMAILLGMLVVVALMGCFIAYSDNEDLAVKNFSLWLAGSTLVAFFTACLGGVIFPDEKDLAIIIAGQWATNSEEMKKLPDNVAATLNAILEQAQSGLKPEPKK